MTSNIASSTLEKLQKAESVLNCSENTAAQEALALTFHAFLLQNGFTSVVETPSNVAGFAPSIRGIVNHSSFICEIFCKVGL